MAEVLSSRAVQWASKVQSIAEQARGLTLEAAQSVTARYSDDSKSIDFVKLLEARSDREKIDGMRRVISRSSKGIDMSQYFASVVKNVASSNLELRKLVYIYITQYAESQPDLALLSINTIQKALSDHNQIVRALALRVMSSIRVSSISGIVLLAIKKCVGDSSFFVRKSAAVAIAKTYALNPELHTQLLECLRVLLADYDPAVLVAAMVTFQLLCPDNIDLIHSNYRRTCSLLSRMDEFSQVDVLGVLEVYCRKCFTSPESPTERQDFYDEEAPVRSKGDLELLLNSVKSLLLSSNSAVVIAACRVLSNLGSAVDASMTVPPLLSLLRASLDIQLIALTNIAVMAIHRPEPWLAHYKRFYIYPTDPRYIWEIKLELLTILINTTNHAEIVSEVSQYARNTVDLDLACAGIRTLGQMTLRLPEISSSCIAVLFEHIKSDSEVMIEEAVIALRHLTQTNPDQHISTIKLLVSNLEHVSAPTARASIFWLVSENLSILPNVAPDVLRIGAFGFVNETECVKMQILTLAVRMYVKYCQHSNDQDVEEMKQVLAHNDREQAEQDHEVPASSNEQVTQDIETDEVPQNTDLEVDSPIPKLYLYITQLVRYDVSYDLRDRLRTYKVLTSSPGWVLTDKLLFTAKPVPSSTSSISGRAQYNLGSSSLLLSKSISGHRDLPSWSKTIIGAAERNVESKAAPIRSLATGTSSSTPAISRNNSDLAVPTISKPKSKLTGITSLDDFYATTSEESEEIESEETSSGEYESTDEEETLIAT